MVALIDDHLTVVCDDIFDLLLPDEALDHCHVQFAIAGLLACSDLADLLRLDAEEQGELCQPLVQERSPMHQDKRAASSLRHEVRANNRFTDAGRRHEHSDVVLEQCSCGFLLHRRQISLKPEPDRFASCALVVNPQRDAIAAEESLEFALAAAW